MDMRISASNLKVFLKLSTDDNYESVIDFLSKKGIDLDLVNHEAIYKGLETGEEVCVVEGIAPKDGTDGRLNFLVDVEKKPVPNLDVNEGKIDYRELGIYEFVDVGQKLVEIIPSTKGVNGRDVYGNVIKASDGRPVILKLGNNVERDGNYIVSSVAGVVKFENDILWVDEILEINRDINFAVGNIKFEGNVVIHGDVYPGFKVVSGSDILIDGIVDSAYLEAKGDIIITGGIVGHGDAIIKSENSIKVKYVNDAKLYAKNLIEVTSESIHSYLESRDKIKVGALIGGKAVAKNEVFCSVAGAVSSPKTEIIVGKDNALEREFEENENKENDYLKNKKKIVSLVTDLKIKKVRGLLTADLGKKLVKLVEMLHKIEGALSAISTEKEKIKSELEKLGSGIIYVDDVLYSNVVITIGNAEYKNSMLIKHVKFIKIGRVVKMYDMDEEIADESKTVALLYKDGHEYNIDLNSINFKNDEVSLKKSAKLALRTNEKVKIVFRHPDLGDNYEFWATVAAIMGEKIILSDIKNLKRRVDPEEVRHYGTVIGELTEILTDTPEKFKVLLLDIGLKNFFVKSEVAFKSDKVFELNVNLGKEEFSALVKPYAGSLPMDGHYETKFYYEKIDAENKEKLKKFINN